MTSNLHDSVQYEIKLTRDIDFFDELLPIWINVRAKIELKKNYKTGFTLVVIPYDDLRTQLYKNNLFNSYRNENREFNFIKCTTDKKHSEEHLRKLKFVMARMYETTIKYNTEYQPLPEPITKEEFNKLCKEKIELQKKMWYGNQMAPELSKEEKDELDKNIKRHNEIIKQLEIQRFIYDPEYFEEIKSLNQKILDQVALSFTEEQNERIKKVLNHPKLEGLISWHGLKLLDGCW